MEAVQHGGIDRSQGAPQGPAMPLLGGSVSLYRFRVLEVRARSPRAMTQALQSDAFVPLDRESGDADRTSGWVTLHDPEVTRLTPGAVLAGDDALLSWRIDEARVPSALVRAELTTWRTAFRDARSRSPTRRETTEEKELILRRLRKQAFVTSRTFDVRWRLDVDELQVWATAMKIVEEVSVALEEGLGMVLRPLGPGPRWEDGPGSAILPTPSLFGAEVSDAGVR